MKRIRPPSIELALDKSAWVAGLIDQAERGAAFRLDLSGQDMADVPESIGQCNSLRHLNLSRNQLTTVPESIGRLTLLENLDLSDNQLRTLPESVARLTLLENLDLSDNQLRTLPESVARLKHLQRLDLSNNQLTNLSMSFLELCSLKELHLQGNEKLGLPAEMMARPEAPRKILDHYFRVLMNQRPLNEAKLILVGPGGAGKTCTVNRLVHDRFNPDEEMTDGIRISEWKLKLRGKENVRLNIWDFGGQEFMHATHQFFFTQRSLYLLVLNEREGRENSDAEYWSSLIDSFGSESPVIVVLNKFNQSPFDVNRLGLQRKYPAIREFIKTDCEDGTGREELLKAIERETERLEHLYDAFPVSWFSIKDRLAGMKENYLTFEQYRNICIDLGEDDPVAQEALAFHLHSLGIVLNYKDDPRLHDMHVLNPHWVTKGIYAILNSELTEKQKGEIRLRDVSAILKTSEYPIQMHRFLLDLMNKFDLCFTFPNDDSHYLIPDLLDEQEPEVSAEFKQEECLNFQYHYRVPPEGLLPRFIVRTHTLSEGLPRWRAGVILQFEGNLGLIKADVQDKKVFISISGPVQGRRRLLAIIRSDFDRIHADIRNLNPEQMIPLPDYPKEVVKYTELFVMEEKGIKTFLRVVGSKVIEIDVDELLNGVDLNREFRSHDQLNGLERTLFERKRVSVFHTRSPQTSININVGGPHMDDYHVGQAGAVGPNPHAHDMTFNQISNEIKESVDLPKLAAELSRLREQMKKDAVTVDHDSAVGDVSKAEQAAKAGDGARTVEYLKSAGSWAFDTATKIGTSLAAEVLKKALLNP